MATKLKMAGMHTAGIFSDMTVDGPVIGTLVVIVDRAKNLPNRKTIGKQDPYCAARLGKEAKKTETDKRGGQTPRWDQELRFTVHDSPDYYQLKVSVFNDDKRTDLIGETWVNLQDVIGKYAGEIRVEITYYDKRPKPEKPEKKEPKQNPSTITPSTSVQSITEFGSVSGGASGSGSLREGVGGPRQLGVKPVVKRRPLPTDPITGAPAQPPVAAAAPIPVAAPPAELVHTPPRGYQAPSAVDHMQMTPTRGYRDSPSAIPDHVQTPPRGYQNVPTGIPDHIQTQGYKMSPNGMPDHVPRGYANPPVIQDQPSPRGYPSSDAMQAQRGYHSPIVGQEHAQTPPRGYQNGFVQDQSPGQRVEYNAPSTRYNQPQGYDISPGSTPYGAPQDMMAGAPPSSQPMRNNDRYDYEHGHDMNQYAAPEADPRDRYGGSRMLTYEPQQPGPYELPMSPGPPPPPPAHASRHVSSVPTLAQPKAVHGRPVSRGNSNPYNTSVDDLHRHSMPAYAQPTSAYQAYNPPKNDDQFRRPGNGNPYPLRKNSYDSRDLRYNSSYEDMQPTVEDAPPTPAPGPGPNSYQTIIPHRGSAPSAMQHPAEGMYDQVPAPLNLRHRPSRNSIATTAPSHQHSISSGGYPTSSSMSSVRDGASVTSRNSYGQLPASRQDRSQSVGVQNTNGDYGLPEMPPTLVPGMDPIIAKEISDRIYNEKRASYSQNPASSQRGRYQEVPRHQPQQIQQPIPLPYHDNSAVVPYSPQAAYDDRQNRYAASTAMVPVKPRGTSPNPAMDRRGNSPNPMDRRGVSPNPMDRRGASPNPPMDRRGASPHPPMDRRVTRKPVSPASEPRRLSGVAFGPDSYDVFNPSLAGSKSATSLSAAYDSKDDPDAKIITYDGREIDPSDHIPESNYAPLLEQKGPKYASQMPDRNYRAPPAEHPMPSNGRKQLRQAARPQSMAVSSPIYFSGGIPDNPPATAHRKLQKKSNRMSAQPAYHSSPNVPIYREPTYASSRTSMQRPSTAEYSNDGYQSNGYQYGSSPGGGYRGAVGPVVPAKIPMALPAPVSSGAGRGGGGGDAWALLEEMKNIDLGAPSSRRRRH
ncbi:c2 domain containing protein [Botrytis cinerea]